MKSLKEMTGLEVIAILIEDRNYKVLARIAGIFASDMENLGKEQRSLIMDIVYSTDSRLYSPDRIKIFYKGFIERFLAFIGVAFSLPINEAEIIEKSLKIGSSDTAHNIFQHAIRANPLVLSDLCKEAKEGMLSHLYPKGRITAEIKVLNKEGSLSPECVAGLKALLK